MSKIVREPSRFTRDKSTVVNREIVKVAEAKTRVVNREVESPKNK